MIISNEKNEHGTEEKRMRKSALVTDDTEINLSIISDLLDAFGIDCVKASSGEEAIKLLTYLEEKKGPGSVAFVLMDYVMPGMNGIEAVEQIKKSGGISSVPVYGMSTDVTDQLLAMYRSMGAVDVLEKPITPGAMHRVVVACLENGDYHVPKRLLDIHENVPEGRTLLKEVLKGVPGIDYEKGIKTALGREESYLKLLKASAKSIRQYARVLDDYVHTMDNKMLTIAAHSLKTIFANIGIDNLKYESDVVENAARKLADPDGTKKSTTPSIMFHEHVHSYMLAAVAAAEGIERAAVEYEKIANSGVDKSGYLSAQEPLDARDRAEVISYTLAALNRFEFDYILEGLEILRKASTGDERIKIEKAIHLLNRYDYDKVRNIVLEISSS